MLMSQEAIAASSIGLPRLGVSADAAGMATSKSEAARSARLGVNMLDLPAAADAPARDRVVMLVGKGQYRRRFRQLAALCDVAGPPFQRHGMRKRVKALLSTGS